MIARMRPFVLPAATFVLALALSIVPLGDRVAPFRPDWVARVLI